MRLGPLREMVNDPVWRGLAVAILCPVLFYGGAYLTRWAPHPLDTSVAIVFITAAAACPVLVLLDVAHWVLGTPTRRMLRDRMSRGLCPFCGYDLRATPARCPECGGVATAATPPFAGEVAPPDRANRPAA